MTTFGSTDRCLDDETLAALADGSLEGSGRDAAEAHLAGCASCRADAIVLADAEAAPAPVGLADRVRARIPAGASTTSSPRLASGASRPREAAMGRLVGSIAALAAAVLVGFLIASGAGGGRGGGERAQINVAVPHVDGQPVADAVRRPALPPLAPSRAESSAIVGDVLPPPRPPDLGGADRWLAHLSTDKPTYRPGERVLARAAILDAFRRTPLSAAERVGFTVRSPRGVEVVKELGTARSGVAEFGWDVPADAAGGTYTLVADAAWLGIPTGEMTFDVRDYRVPRLRTDLQFAKKAYGPGDDVSATVEATRAEGGIPVGAAVTAVARVDGAEVFRKDGLAIDALGRVAVSFTLPKEIAVGEGTLALVIRDGGVQETAAKTIPIVVNRIAITFAPEGGDLVGGTHGRVYFEARTPKQEPADVEGRVLDSRDRVVERLASVHEGRGAFAFTPQTGEAYRVVLDKPAGISSPFPLPAVVASGYALAARAERYGASEAVGVAVASPVDAAATVVLYQREREISMAAVRLSARVPVEVDLPAADASGVLRVTVYDAQGMPRAERLVFRRPASAVHVEMAADASAVPGGKVSVSVKTTDDLGRPVPAVIGVAATDDALLSTIDPRERAPRLPVAALLGAEVRELRDARLYLGDDAESGKRVDLLLATQGWRRFCFAKPDEFEAANGDLASRALARRVIPIPVPSSTLAWDGFADGAAPAGAAGQPDEEAFVEGRPGAVPAKRAADAKRNGEVAKAGAAPPHGLREPNDAAPPLADGPKADDKPQGRPAANVPAEKPMAPRGEWGMPAPAPAAAAPVVPAPAFGPEAKFEAAMDAGEFQPAGREAAEVGARDESERHLRASRRRASRISSWTRVGASVPAWSRVYAHAAAASRAPDARVDFTETVYWNAALETGADGRAQFTFDASDAVTTVRVRADAFTKDGALGEADATVEVRRPFYAEAKCPLEVTAGDRVDLPVSLSNGTAKAMKATLKIEAKGGLALRADGHDVTEIEVPAGGSARVVVGLDVSATAGLADVRVVAEAGAWRDEVTRTVRVVPAGFPVAQDLGGVLEGSAEHDIVVPADVAPGSVETQCAVFPTPLASLVEAVSALLREPCGCFEQTSSTNYPNVMALQYLSTHRGVDPALVKRASELAARGYQRLVGFETKDRGYEWFGGSPGHEALTAYGVMEFADMAPVTAVDAEMLARTRAWLLARRDGKGGFSRNQRALDSFGAAPEEVTNAYIVWALVEAGEKGIDAEIARLAQVAAASKDAYVLALAANAFGRLGDERAAGLRERLATLQEKDGAVRGAETSITRSGGESLEVETTSLAVLAWLPSPQHVKNVESAMTWLLARSKAGRFGSTQATILALKAIVAYDARHARPAKAGTVSLFVDEMPAGSVPFTADAQGAIVVPSFAAKMTPGRHHVRLVMEGGGGADNAMPYALTVRYHVATPASAAQTAVEVTTSIAKTEVAEGEPVEVPVVVRNRTDKGVPMTVAVVGLPGGVEARPEALKALVKEGLVDAFETRGREVVLYWRGLAPGAKQSLTIPCVAAIPGTYTGPASRSYLYYTDEHKVWTPGLAVTVRAK